MLAFRLRQRPVPAAAAASTLVVSAIYLLAQMVGAGGLIVLLLQIPNSNKFGGIALGTVGSWVPRSGRVRPAGGCWVRACSTGRARCPNWTSSR